MNLACFLATEDVLHGPAGEVPPTLATPLMKVTFQPLTPIKY